MTPETIAVRAKGRRRDSSGTRKPRHPISSPSPATQETSSPTVACKPRNFRNAAPGDPPNRADSRERNAPFGTAPRPSAQTAPYATPA